MSRLSLAIVAPFYLELRMKWYKPRQSLKEIENKSQLMATIAVIAIALSVVAIIFAIGKDSNAA